MHQFDLECITEHHWILKVNFYGSKSNVKRLGKKLKLPGESQGRGAWWAAVYGVAQSRTRLK